MKKIQFACASMLVAASMLSTPAAAEEKIVIGLSQTGLKFPYNAAISRGEHKAAEDLGVDVVELDANADLLRQSNDINDLIARGVSGIIMVPMDAKTALTWVDQAKAANVPIVSNEVWIGDYNAHDSHWIYPNLTAMIAPDDIANGKSIGAEVVKDFPKGGKYIVVEGLPGFADVIFRDRGFSAALKESGLSFQEVGRQPADFDPEKGFAVCQNLLTATPDVDFVFAHDAGMGVGCMKAIKAAGSSAKIYAIDSNQAIIQMIEAGEPVKTVCSRPYDSGYMAVQALVDHIKGTKKLDNTHVLYDRIVVSKDNVSACPPQH